MVKGAQNTGGKRIRKKRATFKRRSEGRTERIRLLIVGEGETERNYFDALRREDIVAEKYVITTKKGPGYSPERVVEEAVKIKEQNIKVKKKHQKQDEIYNEVWCVFDVEGQDKRESLEAAVRLAGENGIIPCLSNPCFEVWLLAHFVRSKKEYHHCDAVVVDLNKKWEKHAKQKYQKGDKQIFERVSGLTQTAIGNARKVREIDHKGKENTADCNSSTEVYRLVGRLLGDRLGG